MPRNAHIAHEILTDLCEKLGYDPATVHRIEIMPGVVKVTHNHLIDNPNGGVMETAETAGQGLMLAALERIEKAIKDSTRRSGKAVGDAVTAAASRGARR